MATFREYPGCPVVRFPSFHCFGLGSIPGSGTKILQATQCGQKNTCQMQLVVTIVDSSTSLEKCTQSIQQLEQPFVVQLLRHARLFVIPWIVAHQAPLSMGFPREELPRIFLTQGSNLQLLHWQADSLPLSHLGSPTRKIRLLSYIQGSRITVGEISLNFCKYTIN